MQGISDTVNLFKEALLPVSYTHLDVYKRQVQGILCRYSRKEHGSNNKLYSKPVKEG